MGIDGGPRQSVYNINCTIGVSTVVYCGYQALSIPVAVVDELKSRADDDGKIYIGKKPEPAFPGKIGDKIKFSETSPLFGFIAEIRRVDIGGRLMVKLDKMLGSEREILVNRADVGEVIQQERQDNLLTASEPTTRENQSLAFGGSTPDAKPGGVA